MTDAENLMPKLCPDLKYYFEGDAEAPFCRLSAADKSAPVWKA